MVNQRLLPPTFPRYTEIRTKEATVEYLAKLFDRLTLATQVSTLNTYVSALVSSNLILLLQTKALKVSTLKESKFESVEKFSDKSCNF